MSLWKSTIERLPNLVKYLIIGGVIVFISFLFPNNFKFKYEFDKGQKWQHEDLRASFDFAIRRPIEELEAEQNKVRLNYSPYYELDPGVEKMSLNAFEVTFNQHLEEVKKQGSVCGCGEITRSVFRFW